MKTFITNSSRETKKLGEILANELKGRSARRRIIALEGELGSGKTTFTQGLLKGSGVKGPHTSPTFVILKNYKVKIPNPKYQIPNKSQIPNPKIKNFNIYHIDAYRIKAKDILALGWEEIIREKDSIIIIEWADRIRKIIPRRALWIKFEWAGPPRLARLDSARLAETACRREAGKNKRKITF
jgi:tRNA threonylcarbamoyladenosine biosynthesis protein TsaE